MSNLKIFLVHEEDGTTRYAFRRSVGLQGTYVERNSFEIVGRHKRKWSFELNGATKGYETI